MAIDFGALIARHAGEDGGVPAGEVAKLASAIASAVGREFVPKQRYNDKLDEIAKLEAQKRSVEAGALAAADWEKKYEALKQSFDDFVAEAEAEARLGDVKAAYRRLLEEAGIDGRLLDTIVRATAFDDMRLGEDGRLENADELRKAIEADWAAFRVRTRTRGAHVANPPANGGGSGANPRALEIARAFHARRYGVAPEDGADKD